MKAKKLLFADEHVITIIIVIHFIVLAKIFIHNMHTYRTTIYTQYCVLSKSHEDTGAALKDFESNFTYNHFRFAWYAFLKLMDINYSEGFKCTHCGSVPSTVVMDATSLAFRKDLAPWNSSAVAANSEKGKPHIGR